MVAFLFLVGVGLGIIFTAVLIGLGVYYFWPTRGVYDPPGFDPKTHWTQARKR